MNDVYFWRLEYKSVYVKAFLAFYDPNSFWVGMCPLISFVAPGAGTKAWKVEGEMGLRN